MTQKVAIGTCVEVGLVAGFFLLSYRKSNGTVGVLLANSSDDLANALVGKIWVLATLQNEGAKAQLIAFCAAV